VTDELKKRKIVRKKVSAYPLSGEMVHGTAKVVLSVVRVSVKGLVADVVSGICQVGVHYQCQFTLPTSAFAVHTQCQVSKTHDGIHPRTGKVARQVQVLFIKLADAEKNKIRNFLATIGQRE
jgi:hypothetical protein